VFLEISWGRQKNSSTVPKPSWKERENKSSFAWCVRLEAIHGFLWLS